MSNLTKMAEIYPNGLKTLWEKEKLLVSSNFSFSHSVFERLVSQGRQKVSLCGNGLNVSAKGIDTCRPRSSGSSLHGSISFAICKFFPWQKTTLALDPFDCESIRIQGTQSFVMTQLCNTSLCIKSVSFLSAYFTAFIRYLTHT